MATYRVINLLNETVISPTIQNRAQYPFTMQCAKEFFDNFTGESFECDGIVRSMFIKDGKYVPWPRHSYAEGFLFSYTADEIEQMEKFPPIVATIHFECGGTHPAPYIKVTELQ